MVSWMAVRPPGCLPAGSVATQGVGADQGPSSHGAPWPGCRVVAQGPWDHFQLPLKPKVPTSRPAGQSYSPRVSRDRTPAAAEAQVAAGRPEGTEPVQ